MITWSFEHETESTHGTFLFRPSDRSVCCYGNPATLTLGVSGSGEGPVPNASIDPRDNMPDESQE